MSFYVAFVEEYCYRSYVGSLSHQVSYVIGLFTTRNGAERACDNEILKNLLYDANVPKVYKKDPSFYRAGTTDEDGDILNSWVNFYYICEVEPDSYEYIDATGTMIFEEVIRNERKI